MASTYSPALRLELMATGDQSGTWGDTTNTNLGTLLEQAITGYLSVAQGDVANLTLTEVNGGTDQARNAVVEITGALTATRNVVVQTAEKLYTIKNSTTGGFSIVAKTTAGTGISIPPGASIDCYSDGTNVVAAANYWSGSIGGAVYLDAGAAIGPSFDLFRDSTSPAADDLIGAVVFNGRDSAANKQEYAAIYARIDDATSGSEDGTLVIEVLKAGAAVNYLNIGANAAGTATAGAVGFPQGLISLPSAGVINWNSDVTITHSSNALAFAGASSGYSFDASISVSGDSITLTSTDAGAATGPVLDLYRDSASPAINDFIGAVVFNGEDSASNKQEYARLYARILVPTSGSEDSYASLSISAAGATQDQMYFGLSAAGSASASSVGLPKGQLSFPATQNPSSDANTLDDYEEGQTTPTITAQSGTLTTVSCTLDYVKVGKRVAVSFIITVTTNGTGAGYLFLPLPFTAANARFGGGGLNTTDLFGISIAPFDTNTAGVFKYDGTYPTASGKTLYGGFTYTASA